jgi:hypothetical protein
MDIISQRLIAIGNRILAELRYLSGSIKQSVDATRETSQTDEQQDSPPPEVRAILDAPQGIETRKSTGDEKSDQRHHNQILLVQWILCFATIGAFGAAAYYAHTARLQWYEMREANYQSKEALAKTLDKLQSQVDVAQTANNNAAIANAETKRIGDAANQVTRDALIRVQRAFVFPDTDEPTVIEEGDKGSSPEIIFRFKWRNSGTTPTEDMRTHFSYQWSTLPLPENFTFPDLWGVGKPHINVPVAIGPKGEIGIDSEPLAMSVVEAVRDKKMHLYVWGWAKYRDVFKGTPVHITEFCYDLATARKQVVPTPDPKVQTLSLIWNNCERHNCYDEDCTDYKQRAK